MAAPGKKEKKESISSSGIVDGKSANEKEAKPEVKEKWVNFCLRMSGQIVKTAESIALMMRH